MHTDLKHTWDEPTREKKKMHIKPDCRLKVKEAAYKKEQETTGLYTQLATMWPL